MAEEQEALVAPKSAEKAKAVNEIKRRKEKLEAMQR